MSDLGKRFIDSVNAHPLDAALFMELVQVAVDAMRGKRREIPPAAERIMKPNTLYLSDIPENQMGMAIVAECHKRFPDKEQARNTSQSFLFRWFAVNFAREEGKLKEFIKDGDDGVELINTAVFDVAASCPLVADERGGFDDSFADRVRKLVAEAGEDDGE
jgi:hypothetical protein